MKWLTLKSSAIRNRGDSRSSYLSRPQELNVISSELDQRTIEPLSSLQYKWTGGYMYMVVDDALDARAADHIS